MMYMPNYMTYIIKKIKQFLKKNLLAKFKAPQLNNTFALANK